MDVKPKGTEAVIAMILAVFVWVAFFCPWVRVEFRPGTGIKKALGSSSDSEMTRISGFDIPRLANSGSSKAATRVVQVFSSDARNADKKSYLVWLVPVLASVLAGLTVLAAKNKWLALGVAVAAVVFCAAGTLKILMADLKGLVIVVHITPGLWLTLACYLVMGLMNARLFVIGLRAEGEAATGPAVVSGGQV